MKKIIVSFFSGLLVVGCCAAVFSQESVSDEAMDQSMERSESAMGSGLDSEMNHEQAEADANIERMDESMAGVGTN